MPRYQHWKRADKGFGFRVVELRDSVAEFLTNSIKVVYSAAISYEEPSHIRRIRFHARLEKPNYLSIWFLAT